MITRTTDAIATSGRRAPEPRPPADRAAERDPPRPPPPEAGAVFAVRPETAAVVVAEPASRDPDVPVGADSDSDWVTQDGELAAAAREYDREEAVSPIPESFEYERAEADSPTSVSRALE
ncbi:hypothetical protein [Kribbella sp. CA-247076]|uniref:hypothetical protein n=1 Tax=Kribbella sp. CA-247076 TaxID=3239941 RepID=UPI003D943A85